MVSFDDPLLFHSRDSSSGSRMSTADPLGTADSALMYSDCEGNLLYDDTFFSHRLDASSTIPSSSLYPPCTSQSFMLSFDDILQFESALLLKPAVERCKHALRQEQRIADQLANSAMDEQRRLALKSKLSGIVKEAKESRQVLTKRLVYLEQLEEQVKTEQGQVQWKQFYYNRLVADFLLRDSKTVKLGHDIIERYELHGMVDDKLLEQSLEMQDALIKRHDCTPVLQWCLEHRMAMKKLAEEALSSIGGATNDSACVENVDEVISTNVANSQKTNLNLSALDGGDDVPLLEFHLRAQELIQLKVNEASSGDDQSESVALTYAQKYFAAVDAGNAVFAYSIPWLKRVLMTLLLPLHTPMHPYKSLFNQNKRCAWLARLAYEALCRVYGIAMDPPLLAIVQTGLASYKTPLCCPPLHDIDKEHMNELRKNLQTHPNHPPSDGEEDLYEDQGEEEYEGAMFDVDQEILITEALLRDTLYDEEDIEDETEDSSDDQTVEDGDSINDQRNISLSEDSISSSSNFSSNLETKKRALTNPTLVQRCPACTGPLARLAPYLPYAHYEHTTHLVCYISGLPMNDDNPPMVMPNGNVYSLRALEAQRETRGDGKIKCPRSGTEFGWHELRKCFIT